LLIHLIYIFQQQQQKKKKKKKKKKIYIIILVSDIFNVFTGFVHSIISIFNSSAKTFKVAVFPDPDGPLKISNDGFYK